MIHIKFVLEKKLGLGQIQEYLVIVFLLLSGTSEMEQLQVVVIMVS